MTAARLFELMIGFFLALSLVVLVLGVFVDSGLVLLGVFLLSATGSVYVAVRAAKIRMVSQSPSALSDAGVSGPEQSGSESRQERSNGKQQRRDREH